MIRSMTGFGTAAGRVGSGQVTVEVRTVNHRFFTPSIKLPGSLARFEGDVREALRQKIGRGHVTLYCRYERDEERPAVTIDEERFTQYLLQLRALQLRHSLGPVDIASILRLPDVVSGAPRDPAGEGSLEEVLAVVGAAVAALMTMRADEGARLAGFLLERLRIIETAVARLAARAPARTVEHRDRLRSAVRELTEGLAVDETRLAGEIAILAERMDVQEELDRFKSHIEAFDGAIRDSGGEPVGKRLGFLLQEMLREANTTGSKAADAAMLRDVVLIKEELERIREQVENVE